MIKKAILTSAAVASIAAAAGVFVVAIAYAIFALAREQLTAAGAAGVVAGVFALVLLLTGLALLMKDKVKTKPEPSTAEKVTDFVRTRPLISLAALLGAGFVAVRNPAITATILAAMLAPKSGNKR